uniref:Ribonuclease Z n=1 Tax=Antithamnionella ternifolia TaxID=207919 RepID=A0A4D6WL76_9FLOR|nr:ribonuclease Z [Antithamnionella ternifolia]
MECISLNHGFSFIWNNKTSFIIRLTYIKEIWLINPTDGCQHSMNEQGIKINQIAKILITDLHIDSMSGLLGVLSSLNLSGRGNSLHIYGPYGLEEYLDLGKKYSHTNFCYMLYIHVLNKGLVVDYSHYRLYVTVKNNFFEFFMIAHEKYGKFLLDKAKKFHVISGPLYGKLKKNLNFILPDGFVLNGYNFTQQTCIGIKIYIIFQKYHFRQSLENSISSYIVIQKL